LIRFLDLDVVETIAVAGILLEDLCYCVVSAVQDLSWYASQLLAPLAPPIDVRATAATALHVGLASATLLGAAWSAEQPWLPTWRAAGFSEEVPAVRFAPLGLTAVLDGYSVELSWLNNDQGEAYVVYRAIESGGPYVALAEVHDTSFTDAPESLGQFFYTVRPLADASEGDRPRMEVRVDLVPTH